MGFIKTEMAFRWPTFRFLRPLAYVGVLGLSVVAFSSSSSFLGNAAMELANRNAESATGFTREINVPSTPSAPPRIRPGFEPGASAPPIAAIDPRAGTQPESSTTTIEAPATASDITTLPPPDAFSTAAESPSSTTLPAPASGPQFLTPPEDVAPVAADAGSELAEETPTDLPMPADDVAPHLDTASVANAIEPPQSPEFEDSEESPGGRPFIVRSGVNVHTRPANGSPRVGTLTRGEEVVVVADDQGWLQVASNGEVLGWVYHTFLSPQ